MATASRVLSGSTWCCPLVLLCPNLPKTVIPHPYIEGVFENDLVELDAAGTLAAAEANEHALVTAETRRLHIAAHWADLHPGDNVAQQAAGRRTPGPAGWAPRPSAASPPPSSAVCSASRMARQPGSSPTPWICGTASH